MYCSATGVKRRGGPGGLNKVCGVSPELQAIVGEATMPRTQVPLSTIYSFKASTFFWLKGAEVPLTIGNFGINPLYCIYFLLSIGTSSTFVRFDLSYFLSGELGIP